MITVDELIHAFFLPRRWLFIFPPVGWLIWFFRVETDDFWFPFSMGITIFTILQNYPAIIKNLYGKPYYYDDLLLHNYLKRKLVVQNDQIIVRKLYEQCFVIIATWVISFSTFGLLFYKLFQFKGLLYTKAQIWSLLAGSVAGIDMTQGTLCKFALRILIERQRKRFEEQWQLHFLDLPISPVRLDRAEEIDVKQ
jgi:hypothetical protein